MDCFLLTGLSTGRTGEMSDVSEKGFYVIFIYPYRSRCAVVARYVMTSSKIL